MIDNFLAARRVSTPLVLIRTSDPAITKRTIFEAVTALEKKKDKDKPTPILSWNCILGIIGTNDAGKEAIRQASGKSDLDYIKQASTNCTEALELADKLPTGSILFFENAHQGFDPPNPNFIQAAWNLRDSFKQNRRQLVMLSPGCALPPELAQDVYVLDEPLPNQEQLGSIIDSCFGAVQESKIDTDLRPKAIDAICGLAAFPAEQVTSMSLIRKEDKTLTLDLEKMWERKRQIVESTPGLSIWRGGERFSDIGGLDNAKSFFSRILTGRKPPGTIVFIDEIEKGFAGATAGSSDSSGVSQGFLGLILSEMQNCGYTGMIAVGPPGGGKSYFSKAVGNEGQVPTVELNIGGMKQSLVGQSENNLRNALKTIKAISSGNALWISTCNRIASLPPELRRRFTYGTMFFDLPTREEKNVIWSMYLSKFELDRDQEHPDDTDWTGAEIRTCCDLSWRMDCGLLEAAAYVVPVAKSAPDQLNELRQQANGRFISASYSGVYKHSASDTASGASRAIEV